MILKAFREKSNQKFVNNLLENRSQNVQDKKVRHVGVILNQDEFGDPEPFRALFKEFGLNSPKNTVVFFCEKEEDKRAQWETYFIAKDFGWSGNLKNSELYQFVEEPFDMLIAFYNENRPELHQIVAMSNANFKVGIHKHDERLFDLILELSVSRFDVFKSELKKYLTILKKI